MITNTQRKKLRKGFGTRYTKRIQTYLTDNGLFNKNGNPYSISYINHVFIGRTSDVKIEKAIFEVYNIIIDEHKKISVERKTILNKKPKAATLGS